MKAERLNREAADCIDKDPAQAERLLREALSYDLFYGPAHNNLGVVFLGQSKLYEAATEFEWARKLMPESPDPRVNLALVMESAGRTSEAMQNYEAALALAPESIAAMQGAARIASTHSPHDTRMSRWLETIATRGEGHRWRRWAKYHKVH